MDKEVWEGWTVGAIYEEVKPFMDMIQYQQSIRHKPFTSKKEIEAWLKYDYPSFKKAASDVAKLLASDYNLDSKGIEK